MEKYNSRSPPAYNLTNVKAPVALFYAPTDQIVNKAVTKGLKRF